MKDCYSILRAIFASCSCSSLKSSQEIMVDTIRFMISSVFYLYSLDLESSFFTCATIVFSGFIPSSMMILLISPWLCWRSMDLEPPVRELSMLESKLYFLWLNLCGNSLLTSSAYMRVTDWLFCTNLESDCLSNWTFSFGWGMKLCWFLYVI